MTVLLLALGSVLLLAGLAVAGQVLRANPPAGREDVAERAGQWGHRVLIAITVGLAVLCLDTALRIRESHDDRLTSAELAAATTASRLRIRLATTRSLEGAPLQGVDLRGIVLKGKSLENADLRGANLSDAVLDGADLTGADLTGANLRGATLTSATLNDVLVGGADFTDADMQDATVSLTTLPSQESLVLDGATLRRAHGAVLISGGSAVGTDFREFHGLTAFLFTNASGVLLLPHRGTVVFACNSDLSHSRLPKLLGAPIIVESNLNGTRVEPGFRLPFGDLRGTTMRKMRIADPKSGAKDSSQPLTQHAASRPPMFPRTRYSQDDSEADLVAAGGGTAFTPIRKPDSCDVANTGVAGTLLHGHENQSIRTLHRTVGRAIVSTFTVAVDREFSERTPR